MIFAMDTTEEVKQIIMQAIESAEVYVFDPRNDGKHLRAFVISKSFINESLVKQHQMVMGPLKEKFQMDLHALSIQTFTPEEWENFPKKMEVS